MAYLDTRVCEVVLTHHKDSRQRCKERVGNHVCQDETKEKLPDYFVNKMSKGFFVVPEIVNETVLSYAPGSSERKALQEAYDTLFSSTIDAPMVIGGKEVRTGKTKPLVCPHDHKHPLGQYHVGGAEHVKMAIDAALAAKARWEALDWEHRASIFLKACCLAYRSRTGRRPHGRPVPLEDQRGHHDWPVQERVPGGD